ncbi:related to Nuclear pore complex protein Nup107 [Rhynchosporium agropyri]|uniref:Nuclear pore complex protein n=1 Tax=Rhynchosporium agropyri TaxID=914238 RepID=A0A1E1L3F9_9HELO|nr:related to Nuclear pore complex protein Nup107 [Rhynchosporium agropyri]
MAPMTRSHAIIPMPEGRQARQHPQKSREVSWHFPGSDTQSEREPSVEPPASYDEDADMASNGEQEDEYTKKLPDKGVEKTEDILHPLRETANRVGREVERFAEILDGYNPQRATEQSERHDMMVDLVDFYLQIATDTVQNLRKLHGYERQKKSGLRWRKKMRGFEITDDDEHMDIEDIEEPELTSAGGHTTVEDLERWEQEAQTWDLLRRLVHIRFPAPGDRSQSLQKFAPINQYSSEHELWEDFLEKDELALERKTVLQWLKETADESGEDISVLVQDLQRNADRGDIIAAGWIHTKHAIKGSKMNVGQSSSQTEPLITQLDPDAMTRQKRRLQEQDQYFERAIWLGCYEMLRRGKSPADISEWCMERTEVWRAISMGGFPDERSDDDVDSGDPESSALWRRMCFALARKGGCDDYERAVYGILSGDIQSVEQVCRSWDDFVFANYNALLKTQYDTYLRTALPTSSVSSATLNFESFDAVQFHGKPETAGQRLIDTLKTKDLVAPETLQPMKMLQGVLISNQFSHFIYQQGLALSKAANASGLSNLIPSKDERPENEDSTKYVTMDDHDSLRVLTHVLLIFMGLGLDLGGILKVTEVENVIVAYISFLRLAGKEELIPLYCSQLTGTRKYAILCRNLIDVTDDEQRITQIRLMRELGLDVQEFVSLQARFLLGDFPDEVPNYPASGKFKLFDAVSPSVENPFPRSRRPRKDFFGGDNDAVSRIDMLLIRSMEWYLLVDGMWSETFTVGTLLYLRFFKNMNLGAARELAIKARSSEIAITKTPAILGKIFDFADLGNTEEEDLTEVLDGSANQKRLLKKHLLAEAKTYRELEALIECLDHVETVASIAVILEEDETPGAQKHWRKSLSQSFGLIRVTLEPLLKGWLLTCQNEGAEAQLKLLREAYLPETILAYISVLQIGGTTLTRDLLMECMELSAVIAGDDSDVLEVFRNTGRMQELVEAFAMVSKDLLVITAQRAAPGSRSTCVTLVLRENPGTVESIQRSRAEY